MHGEMTASNDHAWAEVARGARRALREVGYPITAECLPDEPGASLCGHTAQMHALSYFAILQAVAEHQLEHLGAHPSVVADIQLTAAAEIAADCQGVHP
jgi:hypothetical protein